VESQARIPALDGWRGVAIVAVMVSHGFLLQGAATRPLRAIGYIAAHMGGTGVALFFAISGYLITTLLVEERGQTGRISLLGFYVRRGFRILPPAYLFLMVLAMLGGAGLLAEALRPGELAGAAFFYSNYRADRSWYTAHFWSLSMEEHFYFLWPALLAVLGNRRALLAAGILVAATLLWRPWSLLHVNPFPYPALQRTDMRLDAFLFACVLAVLLDGSGRNLLLRILSAVWFRILSSATLIIVWTWTLAGSAPATKTLVESALLPCVLVSVIHRRGPRLFRILESAPLRWIGRISYGLYLWQQVFLVGRTSTTLPMAAAVFLPSVALTFGAATLSYYLLELPLLTYGRTLSNRVRMVSRETRPELQPSSIMEQ
jgi:peptidoglycan/LPS O-acetylase OafA/YrhL